MTCTFPLGELKVEVLEVYAYRAYALHPPIFTNSYVMQISPNTSTRLNLSFAGLIYIIIPIVNTMRKRRTWQPPPIFDVHSALD